MEAKKQKKPKKNQFHKSIISFPTLMHLPLSRNWKCIFLKWQQCHFPVMVFCLFRVIYRGSSNLQEHYASFPIPYFFEQIYPNNCAISCNYIIACQNEFHFLCVFPVGYFVVSKVTFFKVQKKICKSFECKFNLN